MNPSEPERSLSPLLAAWRVVPLRDPRFRSAVWQRIEDARRLPWGRYARRHAPALAGALAAALLLGAWVGRDQARARVEADRAQIVSAYVQALDARSMAMP